MAYIYSILTQSQELLKRAGITSYKLDAEILLFHIMGINKADFIRKPDMTASEKQISQFNQLIKKRINSMPVAKLIGYKEFYSLEFKVSTDVLDPRPDTETLIDTVQKFFPIKNPPTKTEDLMEGKKPDKPGDAGRVNEISILDLGTGSGNIIITLATIYKNAKLCAADISEEALKIAKENAVTHNVENRISFIKSNFLQEVTGKYDLIISNPPYIETSTIKSLDKEVKQYDPLTALDGGEDGLDCYNIIAKNAANYLNIGGYVIVEIGFNQKDTVTDVFLSNNFNLNAQIKDIGGNYRCLVFNIDS